MKRLAGLLILLAAMAPGAKAQGLQDFFKYDPVLENRVDSVFGTLGEKDRVAQMIVTAAGELGKPDTTIKRLVSQHKIGGVVYLRGTKQRHMDLITALDKINSQKKHVPLLHSMDAEPGLLNGRIQGTEKLMSAIEIKTARQCDSVTNIINKELRSLNILQNYAPVCDLSPNNAAIKTRSFGSNRDTVIELSKAFIKATQEDGIIATAKHFPGHGLVVGDTHAQSVYIDGELQELDIYKPLIDAGVVSIMVAHITIRNNAKYGTDGMPSSLSRNIVTNLLKKELNYKGLVISDALNIMKAVTTIPDAPLKASMAGCDIILMPVDEVGTINRILAEMKKNPAYTQQVHQSVKKIIRAKILLGML